jgi:hypothetical protein
MRRSRVRVLFYLVLCAAVLSGCHLARRIKVSDIEQWDLRDQLIAVEGTVTFRCTLLGAGAFVVDDGTGRIAVLTVRGAPPVGRFVRVYGGVQNIVSAGAEGQGDVEINVLLEEGSSKAVLGAAKAVARAIKAAL